MDKSLIMALVVVVMFVLLALMLLGWRNRRRRQSGLPAPRLAGDSLGTPRFEAEGFYVATTSASDPLDRIAVGGLGFRARATLQVTSAGVVLGIPGQVPVWIPADEITGVDRATWTIDRVVESDGLVLLAWELVPDAGDRVPVHSYLRFDTPTQTADYIAAVQQLLAPASASTPKGGTA